MFFWAMHVYVQALSAKYASYLLYMMYYVCEKYVGAGYLELLGELLANYGILMVET